MFGQSLIEISMEQRKLDQTAIEAFYHDCFVKDQVRDFIKMSPVVTGHNTVVDVGGGCGFFAKSLSNECKALVRVLDMDEKSIQACKDAGISAELGDAADPKFHGDETVVCFNLILHHMVTNSEKSTHELQSKVLSVWKGKTKGLFVNEYIYESFFGNLSGALIYQITKSKLLSSIGRLVSKVFPAFKANTFGVGVRFRSHSEWISLFKKAGFKVEAVCIGEAEVVAKPLRLLMIKQIRRDSFWLS